MTSNQWPANSQPRLPAKKDISEEKDQIIYSSDYGEATLQLEMQFLEQVEID